MYKKKITGVEKTSFVKILNYKVLYLWYDIKQ